MRGPRDVADELACRASKAPATPKPRVEGPAALDQPGKAEGEVKLVQADDEQVKAYQVRDTLALGRYSLT